MKNLVLLLTAASILVVTSCRKETIHGEGSTISDTRSVANFNTVSVNGEADVEVIASNSNSVVVTGYSNLVPAYNSYVNGSTLTLEFDSKYINVRNNNIHVKVYTDGLTRCQMNGSGNIVVDPNINTDELETELNGSGKIDVGSGSYNVIRHKVNGSGEINSASATGEDVYAEISGSGDIDVRVSSYLSAQISGSGTVNYWGDPNKVDTDVSGSGKVRKH